MKMYKLIQAALFASTLAFNHHMLAAEVGGAMNHAEHATEATVQAVGVVRAIDTAAGTVTLSHDPIPSINWPAMTMAFKVEGNAAKGVEVGQKVNFQLSGEGNDMTITKMEKAD